jgi:HlyD family secretion protein
MNQLPSSKATPGREPALARAPHRRRRRKLALAALIAIALAAAAPLARLAAQRSAAPAAGPVERVTRRDITLTVEATGTVEPIDVVEVKSKASGQIIRMPVQIGTTVEAGDLLAQIDTRDVENQHAQTTAAVRAAEAKLAISTAQKGRADALFAQQVISAGEHEAATLDYANAEAQVVTARTDLDLADQRLEDATVKAPIAGTILEQLVSNGQVITSATSSASGGTALFKMADLGRIRLRALIAESDIGNIRPGQAAAVTVDAFPQRAFQGRVEKVEPQAVVQQSVTMFPVLISLSNEDRLLLPGMNGEVAMLIEERRDVLAVPVDAVRTVRELPAVAASVGLDPAAASAEIGRQMNERARERGAAVAGGDPGAAGGAGRGSVSAARAQAVFVRTASGLAPRLVRLGLSDFEYAQVTAGLVEGEEVALLGVAEIQAKRTDDQNRIRERMGGGIPGAPGVGSSRSRGGR